MSLKLLKLHIQNSIIIFSSSNGLLPIISPTSEVAAIIYLLIPEPQAGTLDMPLYFPHPIIYHQVFWFYLQNIFKIYQFLSISISTTLLQAIIVSFLIYQLSSY